MTLAEKLATLINAMRGDDLPSAALANARTVILDTLGCTLAGAREPVVEILLRTPGLNTPGQVSIVGRPETLDPLCAALVNGAASHALDFDDVNVAMGGHPSAPLLPALMALAETGSYSGAELLLAFIAGFETETRLARSVNFHHYDKGWHPTATLGVFGAAAACAKLLRLSEHETAMALALCVSLASGVKANFGTMTKPYHVGHCARHGLMAALLAQQGFTASLDAFEHKQGFFNVFNGMGNYSAEKAVAHWADPLDIVEPGIGIKLYPCCDSTHPSIDAVLTLKKQHQFSIGQIVRISTRIHPLRLTHVNRPVLRSALDAKFSVQYCIARAVLDGKIVLDSFTEAAYTDPVAADLMARVEAAPHPDLSQTTEGNYLTELAIVLSDGRTLGMKMDRPFGRSAADPAPAELIYAKYENCASAVLDGDRARQLYERVMDLENVPDWRALKTLWAGDRQ